MTPSKSIGEVVTLQFDFLAQQRFGEVLSSPTITVSVSSGVDTVPADILLNPPVLNGSIVFQNIQEGMAGVIYIIICKVVGSFGSLYVLQRYLAVISTDGFALGSIPVLSGTLPDAIVGAPYSANLNISGGYEPYEPVGLISGAPPWMGFTVVGHELVCAGTPDVAPITYNFFPAILDAALNLSSSSQSIDVTKITLSGDLPDMLAGTVVNFQYGVANGTPPYVLSIGSGVLPAGLSMNSAGLVTGTTSTTGTYSWVVHGVDANLVPADLPDTSIVRASTMFVTPFPGNDGGVNRSLTPLTWGVEKSTPAFPSSALWSFGDGILYIDAATSLASGNMYRSSDLGESFVPFSGLRSAKNRSWLHKTSTGVFIVVYFDAAPSYSLDGLNFVDAAGPVDAYINLASIGATVIAGVNLDKIARSTDSGQSWAASYVLGQLGSRGPSAIVSTPSVGFVIVSEAFPLNKKILTSPSGESGSWTLRALPPGYVGATESGSVVGLAANGNHVVGVVRANLSNVNNTIVSTDGGATWVLGAPVPYANGIGQATAPQMVYANGLFYLCSHTSTVWTSPDGIVPWVLRSTHATPIELRSIAGV